ncbi:MAG: L-aspartate oxidase [Streptosporangiaceae bacterium]
MTGPELRYLPAWQPTWEREADVVVVGSGAAGMAAALAAAGRGRRVLLLTKEDLGGGSTPLAQGGLAAAIGPGDDEGLHRRDTLVAGAGLCEPGAVAALVGAAPAEVVRLAGYGARLERTALHLEGGHSRHRIVTAGGDAIGREVHRVLRAAVAASPVEVLTGGVALDALTDDRGSVGGIWAGLSGRYGELRTGTVRARAVVLATGGFGQAYATTTNPAGVTGDGLALAARAGAELRDLEFVQFHPTVLWHQAAAGQCPLLTEALRGAGAVLVDAAGRPVMAGRHPLGDLAPRDVVSAAMQQSMGLASHLWLDATGLGRAVLERDFPTVTALCRAHGIDPVTEPVPVAPGAHYACGGIRADMDGRTSVPGLYAVGEAASTGVHGANRLASNSLTEALITGRRAGERLGRMLPGPATDLRPPPGGPGADPAARPALAAAMAREAGVLRSPAGLERLSRTLDQVPAGNRLDLATVEATNLHAVSVLVTASARARAESRGCHRWRDVAATGADRPGRHTVLRVEQGRVRVAQPVRQLKKEEVGA